jgi:tyramine---L-glutamate ligase
MNILRYENFINFNLRSYTNLKLLIFEFATAVGVEDPSITTEGKAMLSGLLSDFEDIVADTKDYSVDYLISENLKIKNNGQGRPVHIQEDLENWLSKNIQKYDACLFIAPEEDLILYNLTKTIEDKCVKVIGSSSEAVMMCTDKSKMYNVLKANKSISRYLIPTEKVFFEDINKYGEKYWTISNSKKVKSIKKVVKPADGVSCAGVRVVGSLTQFKKASLDIKPLTKLPYFLIQDYIEGVTSSVSLLVNGKTALPLSLNFQNVDLKDGKIDYNGGYVPLEHELSKRAKEVAKEAVKSIDGLKGYVGVDMILGDDVNIVEINSRLTTPYVALRNILNFNLGKAIVDSVNEKLPSEVFINGKVEFKKEFNNLNIIKVVK